MKKLFIFISAAALMTALSCSKEAAQKIVENTPVNDEPVVSGVETVITANVPESKTTVEEDGTYKWNEGDAINVFGTDGTPCGKFTTDITDPSSSADFTGNVPEGKAPKFALYPYDATASCTSEGVISTVIPTEQDGTIASALSCAVSSDGKNFNFTNAVSVISLNFNASDNICGVSVQFAEAVAGNVEFNCSTGALSGAKSNTVSVTKTSAFNGPVYIALAPTAKKDIILTFTRTDSKTAWMKTTVKNEFAKGNIKKLGTVSGLKFYGTPTDLSKNGSKVETANCYIVPAGGRYKFKATVQGNSSTEIATEKVEYLWSTYNTDTAPESADEIVTNIRLDGDYAVFESSGKKGNVIVAAKDGSGNILWSWHLWCCEGITNVLHKKTGVSLNGQTMLDRNLGALSNDWSDINVDDFGFFYQWGRKDPFVAATVRKPSSFNKIKFAAVHGVAKSLSGGVQTVDYSIANPTVFINRPGGVGDWNSSPDAALWGKTKTKYDPCPVGYSMPTTDSGPWGYFGSNTTWDNTYPGRYFTNTDNVKVWHPAVGFLYSVDGNYSNSTPISLGSEGDYWSYKSESGKSYRWQNAPTCALSPANRGTGMSVRCQKK